MAVTCLVALRPYDDQVKVEKDISTKQKKIKQITEFVECYHLKNLSSKYLLRFDEKKTNFIKKQNKVAYHFYSKYFDKQWQSFS